MATAMGTQDESKGSHPTATSPTTATPPPRAATAPAAAAAPASFVLPRLAFVICAVLISASWFVDLFVVAAVPRLPWAAVVGTVVLLAASFFATIHLFHSFFVPRPPSAAAALPEVVPAIAVAAVGIGGAACVIAACGGAYGYAPARS